MIERILAAVDGSQAAERAVALASELARATGAELVLFHAIRDLPLPPELREMMAAGEINESRRELLEQTGEILLERAGKRAADLGVVPARSEMQLGDPGNAIVAFASDNDVDLIVMGSRGLGQVQGMMLGSVSRKVCNLAATSCLTVK